MDGEAIWELSVCSDQFFCKLLLKKESLLVSKNKKLKNHDGENVGAYYSVPAWWGQCTRPMVFSQEFVGALHVGFIFFLFILFYLFFSMSVLNGKLCSRL